MSETSKTMLRTRRKALKLTQLEVATMLGTSRVTYNKWEQDIDLMPLGKVMQVLKKFEQLEQLKGE